MWNTTRFENHLRERLEVEYGQARGGQFFSTYEVTRGKLVDDVFQQIQGVQPNLSDHGPDHIANVLTNVRYLLSENQIDHKLSATDLYILAMGALFHDVGNLFGREDHHKQVGEIFEWARGTNASVRREKVLVMKLARAHTGIAADGSRDTLKEVDEIDHLGGESVQLRSVAAILRFADELAEGPQRTSELRRLLGLYDPSSKIYHDYASVTNIRIDRPNERILLTYELIIEPTTPEDDCHKALQEFLKFIYERILKLDQERRYARFYSHTLLPFKATRIAFNFHCTGNLLNIDLPQLQLDDKVIPGDQTRELPEFDSRYKLDELAAAVLQAAKTEAAS